MTGTLRFLVTVASAIATLALPLGAAGQAGGSGDGIVLGHSGALSGPLAELNQEYLSGATLYFEQVNQRGGIHGRKIELITLDDAYDPARTEENVRALIDTHKVFALFGVFGTGQNMRAIPVASEARVPLFAPYTGADVLRAPLNPYVFHLRASYGQEIEAIVDHLVTLGVTSIGVVHHSDAFGQAGLTAAETALAQRGRPPLVVVEAIAPNGDGAGEVAERIAAANPAALIMVMAGQSPLSLIPALSEVDVRPMMFGLSVVSSRQLVRELGPAAHGVVLAQVTPSPFRIDHRIVREYRRVAKQAGLSYSHTALEGFLAATTLAEGFERAGKDVTRPRLISALEELQSWDMGGVTLNFSPTHRTGLDFVDLTVVSHGRFSQ